MSKQFKFNINHYIKVRLLDKGYQRMADIHNSYASKGEERTADYYRERADDEGYTKFQMWAFIEDFGVVTHVGMSGFYETEILIEARSLEEVPAP